MSVVDTVMLKIEELNLSVGDRLPSERSLAEYCDISRSSVRNALKELQSKRVLNVKQGSGYFLSSDFALKQALDKQDTEWSMTRISQVFQARMLVAAHVTAMGSQQMTADALLDLENCLVDLGKAVINVDISAMEILHNRFINIIFESSSNPEFIRMLNEVRIPTHYVSKVLQLAEGDERNAYFSEHVNLFQAIKKRDHELAKQICVRMSEYLSALFERYSQMIFQ
ncbi:MAG: FadR family transcriptional regulator [Desulfuromonadales bacterium]|nr:FadR family transcriptional regulator [Desulfuromonadales bacterium]MBN2793446.1 FadR family transcriptional regulator [Desulfuromonadales bacterium]